MSEEIEEKWSVGDECEAVDPGPDEVSWSKARVTSIDPAHNGGLRIGVRPEGYVSRTWYFYDAWPDRRHSRFSRLRRPSVTESKEQHDQTRGDPPRDRAA